MNIKETFAHVQLRVKLLRPHTGCAWITEWWLVLTMYGFVIFELYHAQTIPLFFVHFWFDRKRINTEKESKI